MTGNALSPRTYGDQIVDWLVAEGYSHCFFLAGGNIMHLLDSVRQRLTCVPVVHEVAAGIAAEYFNAVRAPGEGRAFALVTAGPGVTNILTAIAGAFQESRELLVLGGQVKREDLSSPGMRQRGIQEIDGVALTAPVTKRSIRVEAPVSRADFIDAVSASWSGRRGPVFVEICLDAQAAAPIDDAGRPEPSAVGRPPRATSDQVAATGRLLTQSSRPVLLMGGGMSREAARRVLPLVPDLPIATSWNALDRIDYDDRRSFGRPDTWGMRWSNVLLQQADLVIALGARLSLQQTGFRWQEFAPLAQVVHVDIDPSELCKGHPAVDLAVEADAEDFLRQVLEVLDSSGLRSGCAERWKEWLEFGREVRAALPLDDPENVTGDGFLSPYQFADMLSDLLGPSDVLVPCSSGGASTVLMQAFRQREGQVVLNNKALASMGYGLAGAIGAALALPGRRVVHVEGDGGFSQNLQELGTVAAQQLNIKTFLFANDGYASIRMTQKSYFGGTYVGCDRTTGVGLPDWPHVFAAYGIPFHVLDPQDPFAAVAPLLEAEGPAAFAVPVDPEQTYFPKITSRLTASGGMQSNPLHRMTPDLPENVVRRVLPYLPLGATGEQD